ncbi:hypothetical protein DID88_004737 [Monilinia fructigena]|uniref:Endonuclease/exonuclease/phosphatase domain-containing protein n=1 Tax=Monilinia fructigena TaxID=38457 RepID=A0A395IS55_9HELO|nr:hypothetical protein DID88_004737 [Monilinia fructigena]
MASQTPQRPTIANVDAHTRERSPPSPLPFQHIGTIQGTVPIPPVVIPAGTPAFQAVITKLEQMEREATLRRVALEGYAKAVEAFVRNSPDEQKKVCSGDSGGYIGLPESTPLRDRCCKATVQNFLRGGLKTPNTSTVGADPSSKRVASQKRAASPKQSGEPGIMGPQTVRPPTAGNPTPKSPRERTDLRIYARAEPGTLLVRDQPFLIREAITKAVPQISAKDIPRLWATPTGWAVKPNTKAVYDLILKGSNAALICKATRCTILERVEKWHTYRLAHTPNVLTGLLGNRLVTADVVTEEAEIQTGVRPVNCHSAGTSVRRCNNCGAALSKHQGVSGAACTASPRCTGCHGPFPAGHKHCAATPKRADGKIVRLTASQLGEIRRQQTATRKACELAAKSQQERGPKSGVQVVIPTPGARIAAYEAADQQSRRVKRKTAPTAPSLSSCQSEAYTLYPTTRRALPLASAWSLIRPSLPLRPYVLRNGAGRSGEDRATASANGLKVAWANAGRSGPAHIALLQLAFEEGADVVCVQEPSVYPGTRTQNHPAYECYAPVDAWEQVLTAEREAERPRAMSYTRKAANLTTQQRRNGDDRDIVWLEVNGYHIVNVYREPSTRRIIDYITSIQVPPNFLIGGDFNAKHDMFEPGSGPPIRAHP